MTERLAPDAPGLARAAALLAEGAQVAFPTETVYGLGADARNGRAVAGIFAAKGRPSFNPLIVHVPTLETAAALVELSPEAERLAATFWPGALTLVLPARPGNGISELVSAGLPSLGIRIPAHPLARALLEAFGGPVAAPSANPSGRVSPTTAAHVLSGLDGRIAAVLDGGACPVGLESTIVGLTGQPTLLRAGGIPAEALEACLGAPLAAPPANDTPTSPGQLASHYAPQGTLRLNAEAPEPGETYLGFGPGDADLTLSASGDLTEAAANLFACLHALDARGATRIAVAPIPDHGLGRAINDRLRRAAAPRP
ncbi:L-threonylcarbamoyladenylate synthase [Pseudoroseicyclus sp. CXY001]|uniref:L-threonylcarbamoyladenylate synthase n=1 Tax=Pseudoroseicyclus sp. CXY001 TaxID=3242492 RepID=UPI003570B4FA